MNTKTMPLFQFIAAASNASGITQEHILYPSQTVRALIGNHLYFTACRLRWMACIYAEENGMKKSEITKAGGFHVGTVYQARKEMDAMKMDKPLCRILRDTLKELAAIDGRKV